MFGVITAVLNATFGLLVNKARDVTAKKLKDGDLTDEQCRQLIVRELDDIKSKLDGLARKDLLSSVSFLEEGVCLLNMSLDKSSHDETRQDIGQAEALIDEALPFVRLSQAIGRLKIASEERFTAAKASFKSARERATDAFSNEALSTEDRIFATQLRMISRILESLEDPEAAASACLLYLQALHAMPAVREIFSVHASGGMKSLFNKAKRLEKVKSVTMINYILFHFIDKFTKTQCPGVFRWPGIEIGERSYYPLYEGREILANMGVESPCHNLTCDVDVICMKSLAVNSKREIIMARLFAGNVNVLNSQGEIKLFCSLPEEDKEARGFLIRSLAIDDEDNVYLVTSFQQTDNNSSFKLSVFDPEGNFKHQFPLERLSGKNEWVEIAINTAKDIIIHKAKESRVHVYKSGQLQHSFPLEENVYINEVRLSITDKNEIVVAPWFANTVYIYAEEGGFKKTIKLPEDHNVLGVAFDHITKKVIVYTMVMISDNYYLLSYSETSGELQTLPIPTGDWFGKLTSHPSGPVALLHGKEVLYLS